MAKILLVDDDPLLLRMYQTKLENDGNTVETAGNGQEGLKKLETFVPDMILSDIMMPVMNGLEFLASLKSEPSTKKIPVVVLSNISGSLQDEEKALELGAAAYLIKSSYTPKEVVEKVKEILSASVHEIPESKVTMKE